MTRDNNFETLVDSYNLRIQNTIKRFFNSHQDVEDVKQEVYIKTWKHLSSFRGESHLWGWLRTVTLNTCKDQLQKNSKSKNNLNDTDGDILCNIADSRENIEQKSLITERQKAILSAINRLKPKFKEVIILHDIEELTYEEISQKIKCPIGTVKSRLFNARSVLKEELTNLLT